MSKPLLPIFGMNENQNEENEHVKQIDVETVWRKKDQNISTPANKTKISRKVSDLCQ